jgi:putative beta-lysine N-acetyltransferase
MGRSVIQHGPFSDRVYLMKFHPSDLPHLVDTIEELGDRHGYGKLFVKVPASAAQPFLDQGYEIEARIPGLFGGREDGLFLGRYPVEDRRLPDNAPKLDKVLRTARAKAQIPKAFDVDAVVRVLEPNHAPVMAELYKKVFPTYPFPIHLPEFIVKAMQNDTRFFGVLEEGRPVALASAEMDPANRNAEMTDFATHPDHRSRGLAGLILQRMEQAMAEQGICTLYTIARAVSFGINVLFARAGYEHAGLLPNNTNISGGLESMNVWYRRIASR